MLITHKDEPLKCKEITQRPKRKKDKPRYIPVKIRKERVRPSMDHPLKDAFFKARYRQFQQDSQKEKGAQKEKGLLLSKNKKPDISNCVQTGHF